MPLDAPTEPAPAAPTAPASALPPPLGARSWGDLISHVVHTLESGGIRFHSSMDFYPEADEPVQWIGIREDGRKIWKFSLRYLMILDHIIGHTVLGVVDARDGDAQLARAHIVQIYRDAMEALHPSTVHLSKRAGRISAAFEKEIPQDVITEIIVFGPRSLAKELPTGVLTEVVDGHPARFTLRWLVVDETGDPVPSIPWERVPTDVRPTLHDLRRALSDWRFTERRKTEPPTRGDVGWTHMRRFEAQFHHHRSGLALWPIFVLAAANIAVWLGLSHVVHPHEGETFHEWQKFLVCAFATTAIHAFFVAPFLWFTRDLFRLVGTGPYLLLNVLSVSGYFLSQRIIEALPGSIQPVYSSDGLVLGLGAALAAVTLRLRDRLPDLVARHWYFVGLYATLPLHGAFVGLAMEGGKWLLRLYPPLAFLYFFLIASAVMTGGVMLATHQIYQMRNGPVPLPKWLKRSVGGLAGLLSMALSSFLLYRYGWADGQGWVYANGGPGRMYELLAKVQLDLPHLGGWFPGLFSAMLVGAAYGWRAAQYAEDALPVGWAGERSRNIDKTTTTAAVVVSAPVHVRPAARREREVSARIAVAPDGITSDWREGGAVSAYMLETCLGQTILGPVWRGHAAENPGDRVAIKQIPAEAAVDADLLRELPRYFRPDGDSRSGLMKAGIARVREVGDLAGAGGTYMISDYIEGISLAHRLTHKVPLTERAIVRIHIAIARVLDAVHEEGLLHRDIRPSNILLTQAQIGALTRQDLVPEVGYAVLADFGLACRTGRPAVNARGEQVRVGTPGYIPPEAWSESWLDRRYDVYSLGVSLYYCLSGRRFNGEDRPFIEQFEAMLAEGVPAWPEEAYFKRLLFARERLGAELGAVVAKASGVDRSFRYSTALEMATDLEAWLEARPLTSVEYTPRKRIYFDMLKAHPLVTTALAGGLVFGIAAGFGWVDMRLKMMTERGDFHDAMAKAQTSLKDAEHERTSLQESYEERILHTREGSLAWHAQTRQMTEQELRSLEAETWRGFERERWLSTGAGGDPILDVIALLSAGRMRAGQLQKYYTWFCARGRELLGAGAASEISLAEEKFGSEVERMSREFDAVRQALSKINDLLVSRHRLSSWGRLDLPIRLSEARAWTAKLGEARREAERQPRLGSLQQEITKREAEWESAVGSTRHRNTREMSLGELVLGGVKGRIIMVPFWWSGDGGPVGDDLILRGPYLYWISLDDLTSEDGTLSFAEAQRSAAALAARMSVAERASLAEYFRRMSTPWNSSAPGLSFRLPTVSEWELAARGMDGRTYPWGNERPGEREEARILRGPATPGEDSRDRSPFGLRYLAGRFAEWVTADQDPGEGWMAGAGYWDLRLVRAHQFRRFDQEPPGRMGYRVVVVPVIRE